MWYVSRHYAVLTCRTCLYNIYYAVTVNLSAKALSIPGGYVVPEGSNLTFTCNSSLGGILWTLNLKVPGGIAEFTASVGLARLLPQVSSPDTTPLANPATISIHSLTSENNHSTVQCINGIMGTELSSARVIVEGKEWNTILQTSTIWKGIQGTCVCIQCKLQYTPLI